jgi:hypothetical protein
MIKMGNLHCKRNDVLLIVLLTVVLSGCSTNPGRTTGIGTGAGAAIGASLGALVGAGAGDPGTGAALGLAAGSATGAFVGNAIEGQDKEIARQGEIIRTQDSALMSQRAELDRLRSQMGDVGSARGGYNVNSDSNTLNNSPFDSYPVAEEVRRQDRNSRTTISGNNGISGGRGDDGFWSSSKQPGQRQSGDMNFGDQLTNNSNSKGDYKEPTEFKSSESSDGTVFISKSSSSRSAATNTESSGIRYAEGAKGAILSASHPLNRFSKFRDNKSLGKSVQDKQNSISVARVENKRDVASGVAGGTYASTTSSSSAPKRGRTALSDSNDSGGIDNVQGLDKKMLAATQDIGNEVNSHSAKPKLATRKTEEEHHSVPEGAIVLSGGDRKECADATKELALAEERTLPEDKLFHLRRALRLCPEEVRYHLEIAALYRSQGRDGDAIYEYQEAMKVDPDNKEAQAALRELGSSVG